MRKVKTKGRQMAITESCKYEIRDGQSSCWASSYRYIQLKESESPDWVTVQTHTLATVDHRRLVI